MKNGCFRVPEVETCVWGNWKEKILHIKKGCDKIEWIRKKRGIIEMERYCDLHTHSVFSDGTCTPGEIVDMAVEMGLSAVALCDHNTVAGLSDFFAAAQGKPIEAVGGVELSTEYAGKDLHIVGLFIEPEHYDGITALMEQGNREKAESNRKLANTLYSLGYELDYDELCARHPRGQINRAHIAAWLTEKGYTKSIKHAFSTLLSTERGYYQPPRSITSLDAISYLKSIGAVAILAHPFLDLNEEELTVFLPQAKEAGLDAMEALYSCFDSAEWETAACLAQRFELLPSGGSDFHGQNKPDISLGRGRGDLFIPEEFLTALKKRKTSR